MSGNAVLMRLRAARTAAVLFAVTVALMWSNVAYARQSSDDQYGAPVAQSSPPAGDGVTGGLLPDTGGSAVVVFLAIGLLVAGAGLMLLRRQAANRNQ